jgi:hypothetical protein
MTRMVCESESVRSEDCRGVMKMAVLMAADIHKGPGRTSKDSQNGFCFGSPLPGPGLRDKDQEHYLPESGGYFKGE